MSADAHRRRMVLHDLARRGIHDPAVLEAMADVPRERFVVTRKPAEAYADRPLPIGEGQTISQPYVVALMAELLELGPDDRVLEVGAGSGYAAAVLGRIAGEVHSVERIGSLATSAAARVEGLGLTNVHVHHGDGSLGWPAAAPYDAILTSAGAPAAPAALLEQLALGGRLVIPVGSLDHGQSLRRIRRTGPNAYDEEDLGQVAFVPLIGEQGW